MQDLLAAVVELLKKDADLAVLVDGRVYGDELPEAVASAVPTKLVFIRHASGGAPQGGYVELQAYELELVTAGGTPAEAMEVHNAATTALKQARRQVVEETLVHSFDMTTTPHASRDAETQWPVVPSNWRALAAERQAITGG